MRRFTGVVVLSVLGMLSAASCGKSADAPDDCAAGSERCDCYGNGTCDGALECRSNRCVDPEGASGSGANPSGGAAGSTGGVGEGGTAQGGSSTGGSDRGGSSTGGSSSGGEGGDGNGDSGGTSGVAGKGGTSSGGSSGMGGGSAGAGGKAMAGAGFGGMALGGGGLGGVSGAAGSSSGCGPIVGASTDTLIDNLEDNDNVLAPPRVGYWFVFTDGTCATIPPVDPSGVNPFLPASGAGQNASFGARLRGGNCTLWGAGLGFDLNNCGSRAQAYDATAFQGISFWYRSTAPFRMIIVTLDAIPTTRGGTCVPGTGSGSECDNGHGASLPVSAAGSVVAIPFTLLSQEFGQMRSFDRSKLVYVELQFGTLTGTTFELTVDNVSFTP